MRPDPDALGDIHSHLVPDVDDGARTLTAALDAVAEFTRLGVRRIVTTPHLDASLLEDDKAADRRIKKVQESFRALAVQVRKQFPEVVLSRGFEVKLDLPDPDLSDPRVRMAGTRFALVEWPGMRVPPGTEAVLARIRKNGWIPVVAHPERYHGLDDALELPRRWKASGAFLQLNHGSVVGRYGDTPRNRALKMLQDGVADYLSSDYHPRPGERLRVSEVRELLEQEGALDSFHILTRANPQRLMEDKEPLSVPAFQVRPGFLTRIRTFLGG